ncbi:MAG: transcriptional regulator [Hydrogenophaga sp.]|nr:transcriptional regulator [Hydrogenophaga sp.]
MNSKDLMQVATQRELDLFRQPEPNDVPLDLIRKQPGPGAAFTMACSSSGLADQTIYEFVGIDAGTFSKIKKGLATLQADLLNKFCYAVNNRIYPEWCAYQLGCTLVQIQSEAERQLAIEREARKDAELKLSVLMETFRVRTAA